MKLDSLTDDQSNRRRIKNLRLLVKQQEELIELLQAQLKHKEKMLEASDLAVREIIAAHQKEQLM